MSDSLLTPVLFQFFDNPDTSLKVFMEIRKQRPLHLYLVQDGCRTSSNRECERLLLVRAGILELIDWECDLHTLFRNVNLGPGKGTSEAIIWFFSQVDEGIVIEHDCLPHPDFFAYCENLLARYRYNTEIQLINGSNLQKGKKYGHSSYYFCKTGSLWGWAGWKRTITHYEYDIHKIDFRQLQIDIERNFKTRREREYWKDSYDWIKTGIANTWDFQLLYKLWHDNALIVQPNHNLISNIGFGNQAIHCKDPTSLSANMATEKILPVRHPKRLKPHASADTHYLDIYLADETYKLMNPSLQFKRKIKQLLRKIIRK
jgi:hypothetical protein